MKKGCLSEFYKSVAFRTLTPNDVDPRVSNQHELDGSAALRAMLGEKPRMRDDRIPTKCFYFTDSIEEPVKAEILCSWYDSRANQPRRSSEWRLYYQDSPILGKKGHANKDDLLIVAIDQDETQLTIIVVDSESSYIPKFKWLFGLDSEESGTFLTQQIAAVDKDAMNLAARQVAEELEIELQLEDENLLEGIIEAFGKKFPTSAAFSKYARNNCADTDPQKSPDDALLSWLNHEELLFRTLEKAILQDRLKKGFSDVDEFISVSLSVQNRRKSRAGNSFENHLNHLFLVSSMVFKWKPRVEGGKRPDFLFPGEKQYFDNDFPESRLSILGAKTTCKDRWRQVINEGNRVKTKHLVTLEAGISINQLTEMEESNLQLVVPEMLKDTFHESKRENIWSIERFIEHIRRLQV